MLDRDKVFIDGAWVPSTSGARLDVVDSTTEEVMARVPEGTAQDVEAAVAAARAAQPAWAASSVEERAKHLQRVAEGLQNRMSDIAAAVSAEVGMPLHMAAVIQAGLPLITFSSIPQILRDFVFEEQVGNSLVVSEPVGVVACITPWNYPLHQLALKVAPALAAGNAVVAKPSEVAPLSAFILAEVIDEAGLPPGVFNLVSGTGAVVGEALVAHPDVDMVSFTGSTRAGRRVGELASQMVKRVSLELGGKGANVLLDDCDLPKAVRYGVGHAFLNAGQTCIALSRMIVPRTRLAEVEQLAADAAEGYRAGDPSEPTTRLGPLASAAQQERVRSYIAKGEAEGARLVTGGAEQPEGLERGYFVRPTIFSGVEPDMTIAQEEIFGPVLSIIPYDTEEEAVAIANGTIYGLSAGVWSGDLDRAKAVARRLRAGMVEINGGAFNPLAPFGGVKQSGAGREGGRFGLEEFLELKTLQL